MKKLANLNIKIRNQGFTLLEAIVAMVLISSTGLALFSWINTNLISLSKVQQVQYRNEAIRNAIAFVDTLNPQKRPEGSEKIGAYTFEWQTKIIKPLKSGMNKNGGSSHYQIALYDIDMKIIRNKNKKIIARFNLNQVGYKLTQRSKNIPIL
jgi:general secretion pathway protein I